MIGKLHLPLMIFAFGSSLTTALFTIDRALCAYLVKVKVVNTRHLLDYISLGQGRGVCHVYRFKS